MRLSRIAECAGTIQKGRCSNRHGMSKSMSCYDSCNVIMLLSLQMQINGKDWKGLSPYQGACRPARYLMYTHYSKLLTRRDDYKQDPQWKDPNITQSQMCICSISPKT
jgi:hypothetical protein